MPLHNVKVNDPKAGAVTCEATTLAPGQAMNCAADAPYVGVGEDRRNRGQGRQHRHLHRNRSGRQRRRSPTKTAETRCPTAPAPAPALSIEKTAGTPVNKNNSGITDAGDTIAYTFVVTNTGNVPLHDVKVNDRKAGAVTCEATTLAPGQAINCAADAPYVVGRADETAGKVVNTATSTGTDPDNGGVTSNEDSAPKPRSPHRHRHCPSRRRPAPRW